MFNPDTGWPSFSCFDASFKLETLKQTGDLPWIDGWQIALGPTGLLVTDGDKRFWIGVLSAG